MTSDANSGRAGLWIEPKYPGDAVRELLIKRGPEVGMVLIQHYTTFVKVGMFVPGVYECSPGDTPKTWPNKSETCTSSPAADAVFDNYVQEVYADGWENYHG